MTGVEITPEQCVLAAIDIAKHRHEVLIAEPGRKRRRRVTVRNIAEDIAQLIKVLDAYQRPVQIGFEPTGDYHPPIAWRLHQAGFQLHSISSYALARTREVLHNGRGKNDPKDAQVMLHMLQTGCVSTGMIRSSKAFTIFRRFPDRVPALHRRVGPRRENPLCVCRRGVKATTS